MKESKEAGEKKEVGGERKDHTKKLIAKKHSIGFLLS
jgi:hypothetical protein